MNDDPKPVVRALVGYGDWYVSEHIVSLEDAAAASQCGFAVLIDPEDEALLARWYQIHSPRQPWTRW